MKTLKKFSATWCVPCKQLSETLNEIDLVAQGVIIEEYDADTQTIEFHKHGVRSVPTLILFDSEQKEKARTTGNKQKDDILLFLQR